jgi:uncharacterized protein (DUF58 family)
MIVSLRRRLLNWWQSRLPATDTWTLTQRNIYIVPTRAGFMFMLVLVVMLLAAINYQLSLGYVLTFLLAGAGFMSMHLTHGTLRGLTLHLKPPASGFAGMALPMEVVVASPRRAQHGIGLGYEGQPASDDVFVDVPAGGQTTAHLAYTPAARGWHTLPLLRAETRYPLGLFRAWTVWRPASRILAWPVPEHPAAPLPPSPPAQGESPTQRPSSSGEFDGVRSYRRGDAIKRVVWKKVARTGELVTRDASAAVEQELWLDWQATPGAGVEARLSRLAAWVVQADHAGLTHGLRLPGREIAPAQGLGHRRRSLDALAEF